LTGYKLDPHGKLDCEVDTGSLKSVNLLSLAHSMDGLRPYPSAFNLSTLCYEFQAMFGSVVNPATTFNVT
jgi:hypothetical protein